MKRYVLAGLGVLFFGVMGSVQAEMEVKVKDNTTNNGFSIKEETTGSTITRFRGDGNVGIGTTNPITKLNVAGSVLISGVDNKLIVDGNVTGNQGVILDAANNMGRIVLTGGAGGFTIGRKSESDDVYFSHNYGLELSAGNFRPININSVNVNVGRTEVPTTLQVIGTATVSGNIGIGTINPARPLHVEKSSNGQVVWFKNTATTNSHGLLIQTASAASDDFALDVRPNGVIGGFIVENTGNVGIGTTNPAYKLDVNGTIRGSNVSPSDMRWKEQVKTLDNSLEKINKLRGVSFEWKDKAKGNGTQVGLIAQEVEAVFPEVVSEDNEGYKSVAYDKLVGVLVESIKELKAEKDAEIAALKAEIEAIKASVSNNVRVVAQ